MRTLWEVAKIEWRKWWHKKKKMPLNQEERLVIELSSNGYAMKDIARIIGYHKRTLEVKTAYTRERFGAVNMKHMIGIAFRRGWIK
jgi:DNA-binding NarL/FixJ family response regulator